MTLSILQADFGQFRPQVLAFVLSQNTQGEADQGPKVNHPVVTAEMPADILYLRMTVVTALNAIIGAGGFNLLLDNFSLLVPQPHA